MLRRLVGCCGRAPERDRAEGDVDTTRSGIMTDDTGAQSRPATGRRRSTRTHQAILDTTIELLAEVGYQELSFERIAALAGVGKATIYRWWESKSALVVEALDARMSLAGVTRTGDPRTDLRAVIAAAADTHVATLVGATLPALASSIPDESPIAERLRQFLRPQRDSARQVLHHAAAVGVLPPDVAIEMIIDICIGAIFYRGLIGGHGAGEDMVEQLVALILDGRLPRTTQPPGEASRAAHPTHGRTAAKRGRTSVKQQ
jgi:AcrR family transcriptional regulator